MEPVILHHLATSHFCEKARAVLAYKQIPFTIKDVTYGDHTETLQTSGQDYVPYIEIPGKEGVTWPKVADWAEEVKPEPTIYPAGSRPRCRILESWAHNVIEEMVWRFVVSDMPKYLPTEREKWVFVEMQERQRGPLEFMEQRKPQTIHGVEEVCGLAQDLLGEKSYMLAESPSLADFAIWGALHPLKYTHNEIPEQFSPLREWYGRVNGLIGERELGSTA